MYVVLQYIHIFISIFTSNCMYSDNVYSFASPGFKLFLLLDGTVYCRPFLTPVLGCSKHDYTNPWLV